MRQLFSAEIPLRCEACRAAPRACKCTLLLLPQRLQTSRSVEARLSQSKPGRGLVRTSNRVVKQDGTVALVYTPLRMLKCKQKPA